MLREQLAEGHADADGAARQQEVPIGSSQPHLLPVSPDEGSEGEL